MAANPVPSRVLTLHTRTEPDAIVVECRGRLVREAGDQLRQTVKPLIPQTRRTWIAPVWESWSGYMSRPAAPAASFSSLI